MDRGGGRGSGWGGGGGISTVTFPVVLVLSVYFCLLYDFIKLISCDCFCLDYLQNEMT